MFNNAINTKSVTHKKAQLLLTGLFNLIKDYLFITYIVTSKPKRISVAAGVVHMINSLLSLAFHNDSLHVLQYAPPS